MEAEARKGVTWLACRQLPTREVPNTSILSGVPPLQLCNSTVQLRFILGLSPSLAGSTAWALDCRVGWMWCRNPGLGFSRCGSETLPCCAALGKSLHLSEPPPSPLKHGRSEVRSGLALSFSNSALLCLGIKLEDM